MSLDREGFFRLQEPLKLFVEEYAEFVASAKFKTPHEPKRFANPGAIRRIVAKPPGKNLLLRTKFGLQLYVEDLGPPAKEPEFFEMKSRDPTWNRTSSSRPKRTAIQYPRINYLICPDVLSSSFLWHDPNWVKRPVDEFMVRQNEIERRYPDLASYFAAWREFYVESHGEQGCDSDEELEVFPDDETTAAWQTAGFLMAYWLVQQDDVNRVKYKLDRRTYRLDQWNRKSILREFLRAQYQKYGEVKRRP